LTIYDHFVETEPVAAQESADPLLDAFMQLSPDAAVVVDRDGIIRAANRLAVAMFGYPVAELDGQPVELLIPDRLRPATSVTFAAIRMPRVPVRWATPAWTWPRSAT
jgi:PAS domain S-box-containing protein